MSLISEHRNEMAKRVKLRCLYSVLDEVIATGKIKGMSEEEISEDWIFWWDNYGAPYSEYEHFSTVPFDFNNLCFKEQFPSVEMLTTMQSIEGVDHYLQSNSIQHHRLTRHLIRCHLFSAISYYFLDLYPTYKNKKHQLFSLENHKSASYVSVCLLEKIRPSILPADAIIENAHRAESLGVYMSGHIYALLDLYKMSNKWKA